MEENESKQGKSISKDLQNEDKIKKAIEVAILNDKAEVNLDDGKSIISLKLIKDDVNKIYDVQFDENTSIARVRRTNDGVQYDYYNSNVRKKIPDQFDLNKAQIRIQNEEREKIKLQKEMEKGTEPKKVSPSREEQSKALQVEMNQKIKSGNAVQMEIDREFSTTENMRMFVKRGFGVSAQEIYRVQGKDPHNFRYIAKTGNEKEPYKEIDLSNHREGRNSGQKIWIMENGELKEKAVDSILLKGNYGIATDVPDNALSDNTRTYLVSRTPDGKYLAIAAGQKYGVNRNTSGDVIQKDLMSRSRSVYELEDTIESAQLAEKIYGLTKDGKLTTNEIAMVKKFKIDKNMDDKEVINIINAISLLREIGYHPNEIKEIIDSVKKTPSNKEEALKLATRMEEKEHLNEKTIFDGTEEGREHSIPGQSPRHNW